MGKGIIYIMVSRFIWILSGFVIHISLGRFLGPKLYGIFGVILSLMSVIFIIVGHGIRQAITKFSASDLTVAGAIKTIGLKIQILFSLIIGTAFFCFSGPIATLLGDSTLTNYIKLSALTIPPTAIIFVYIGSLEGLKQFKESATISIVYAFAKMIFVILLVLLGLKVYGAIIGMILSVVFATLLGSFFCRGQSNEGYFELAVLIKFAVPISLFFIAIAILSHIDILFAKSLLGDDTKIGYYTSAQALSKVVYFFFAAFSVVLLPSISSATANNDVELIKKYVKQSLRYMVMLLIPTSLIISATSGKLINLFYSSDYVAAAYPLSILVFGISFLSITLALSTIMQGYGTPKTPLVIFSILVPLDVCLLLLLIPRLELIGAALATSVTCLVGLVISCIFIYKEFKTLLSISSLVKIILASTIVYLIALKLSFPGFLLPFYYFGLLILYFLILLIFREINGEDMFMVKKMLFSFHNRRLES